MQRYDNFSISATKTDEGYILDTPVIGRTGILRYRNADGSERREYRPPEEAFKADSLKTLRGKPITLGHKGMLNTDTIKRSGPVGTIMSEGRRDGETIRADVVIYNLDTASRELSCGYTTDLEFTSGMTPQGEHYDAIQRNIRYNHVAIVPKGRAGIARLNMDGDECIDIDIKQEGDNIMSEQTLSRVRLDNGLEYQAAPEVSVFIKTLKTEKFELQKKNDELSARFDAKNAEYEKEKKLREDAEKNFNKKFDEAVREAAALLNAAAAYKIEKADSMKSIDIKKAIIKSVHGDSVNLDGKSDDYVNAMYDIVTLAKKEDGIKEQRKELVRKPDGQVKFDENDPKAAYDELRRAEASLWEKEVN